MKMNSKIILKYSKKSQSNLLSTCQRWFNEFIRLRDTDENGYGRCISSNVSLKLGTANAQAGHYIAAGSSSVLRFNEDNVHLQGKSDNYFKSGNQIEYRKNLIKKIGVEQVEVLENYSKSAHKWDRFTLIDKIEEYKGKVNALKKTKML
jgi:hypothetical protein